MKSEYYSGTKVAGPVPATCCRYTSITPPLLYLYHLPKFRLHRYNVTGSSLRIIGIMDREEKEYKDAPQRMSQTSDSESDSCCAVCTYMKLKAARQRDFYYYSSDYDNTEEKYR